MKCPNCGAEMKDNLLYCEKCGEDIHIVPDFEPELERNMEQSMEHILEEVAQEDGQAGKNADQNAAGASGGDSGKRLRRIVGWIGIGVLVLLLIVGGTTLFQYFSPDYQIQRARQATTSEQYEKAIRYYTRAMELDRFNVDLKLELAGVYFLKNDKTEYEYWLLDIVTDPNTNAEQLESAYGKLIAVYRAREDYQGINDMLLDCESEAIRTTYQNYLAEPPQFSVAGGEYDEVQALKITVTGKGTIYYTLNGRKPDENAERYTTPIILENGSHTVKAVYINENGVSSNIVEARYSITVEELEAPELNVDDGEYDTPVFITVTNDIEEIYYTADGSTPTMDSAQYTGPIPMPLGVSHFKFARLEIGRSSEIVERRFVFVLNTDITPEKAVDQVRENALASGKIYDNSGHFDDTEACYEYHYLWVADINESAYYAVAEVLVDAQGVAARTGNYFAINAYSGSFYKLNIENGVYTLIEI